VVTVTVSGAGAGSLEVQDEGGTANTVPVTILNFTGPGVTAIEGTPGEIDVTISGSLTVLDEGGSASSAPVTYMDFVGAGVTVTEPTTPGEVVVTIPGGVTLTSSAPANVTTTAAAVGVSTEAARADHKHDVTTGTPSSVGIANSAGSATSLAASDHVHSHGNLPGGTLHSVASAIADGFMASADFTKLAGLQAGFTEVTVAARTDTLDGTTVDTHRTYTAASDGADVEVTVNSGTAGRWCLLSRLGAGFEDAAGINLVEGTATLVFAGNNTFALNQYDTVTLLWRTTTEVWLLPHFYRPISVYQGAPGVENPPRTSNVNSFVFEGATVVNSGGQVTITTPDTASELSFTPDGDIAATDVQAAIVEVRDDTDTKLSAKGPVRLTIFEIDDAQYLSGGIYTDITGAQNNNQVIRHTGTDLTRNITVKTGTAGDSCVVTNMISGSQINFIADTGIDIFGGDGQTSGAGSFSMNDQYAPCTLIWLASDTVLLTGAFTYV